MSHETYDIVVLGVGGMGAAALYHLAQRDVTVCGVERFGIAHDRGSSHGETRIIRKAYFEHPDYIPLLDRAYELWRQLAEETGEELYLLSGLLVAAPPESETIRGLEVCYRQHDLPHQRWNSAEARTHFPQFRFKNDAAVFYDPNGGFLYVEKCVEEHIRGAVRRGARLYTGEQVIFWTADGQSVVVETDRRRIGAGALVLTPGAWARRDLVDLGIDLEIWRKVLFWYDTAGCSDYRPDVFPTFYVEIDSGGFYGFPAIGSYGLKVGEHLLPEVVADPDDLRRELEPEDEPKFLDFLAQTFPDLMPRRTRFAVCMYTNTPDHHFILDNHPEHPNVVLGAGFSGHGFKFAPVVGEVLADLALEGRTSQPIDFLRLDRFSPR